MSFHNVIIYAVAGAQPDADPIVTANDAGRTTIIAADPDHIVAAAVAATDADADRIELCGATGPVVQAKVRAAVGDRVPVGTVMFGFESLSGVADYKARYGSEFLGEAFIYVQPGSDPGIDRTVRETEHSRSIFVAVPDAASAPAVAAALVAEDGVRLLELYGGFGPDEGAAVIEAIEARVPVGIPSYGYVGASRG